MMVVLTDAAHSEMFALSVPDAPPIHVPDSLPSGNAAQDVGGAESSASATGVVNGIGSLGGILSGILPIWLQQKFGWDAVFILFIVLTIAGILLLIPVALRKEIGKS